MVVLPALSVAVTVYDVRADRAGRRPSPAPEHDDTPDAVSMHEYTGATEESSSMLVALEGVVIEMTGPVVSIVNDFDFIASTFPALSVAWNWIVCEPLPETANGPE